eukprot:m.239838 g.239838  ORF g.239838 m.239838 type:complete len:65 (-) comp14109_c0_seq1:13-207(-)
MRNRIARCSSVTPNPKPPPSLGTISLIFFLPFFSDQPQQTLQQTKIRRGKTKTLNGLLQLHSLT